MNNQVDKAHWRQETVYSDGDSFYDAMLADIERASHSIDLETYIFEDDDFGRRVCEALARAAARGVRVRVMVDGFGSSTWPSSRLAAILKTIPIRVFHPIPWIWKYVTLHPARLAAKLKRMIRLLSRVNRRNHRKTCVIDNTVAYVGSMNVSAWHLPSLKGKDAWRDSGARVEGSAIIALTSAFGWAWAEAREPGQRPVRIRRRRHAEVTGLVRLNHARTLRRENYHDFLQRIATARARVWLTNPYFVPAPSLMRALRVAAFHGTDVRLIVPRKSDVPLMRWVAIAFYRDLLKGGVRVFEYLPSVLHAKVAMLDEWAMVGSSNLNHRSLIHDLEVDIVITSPGGHLELERQFVRDTQASEEITMSTWKSLGVTARVVGKIGYWLRYYL